MKTECVRARTSSGENRSRERALTKLSSRRRFLGSRARKLEEHEQWSGQLSGKRIREGQARRHLRTGIRPANRRPRLTEKLTHPHSRPRTLAASRTENAQQINPSFTSSTTKMRPCEHRRKRRRDLTAH
jgi:hypothetical protein